MIAIDRGEGGTHLRRGFPKWHPHQRLARRIQWNSSTKNMGNTFKTAFLLTALTLLLMFIGRAFGGQNGMFIALAFACVMNFVSYFWSDKIALTMYRAQP